MLINFEIFPLIFSGQTLNELNFLLIIWGPVFSENIVEPDFGFRTIGHWSIPSIDGIGFAGNQAPIISSNIFAFQNRHNVFKQAVTRACHIFRTNKRLLSKQAKCIDIPFMVDRIAIIVIGNDVGIFDLIIAKFFKSQFQMPAERVVMD